MTSVDPVSVKKKTSVEERRLCAGDWVRLADAAGSIRGLGKVVDALYDPEDSSLRRALVEFARGAHWFWPGDLRRIEADEEIRLCERALEVATMPEPARDRVKAALIEPPRPRTARSLGLLDLLWSLLGSLVNERAVSGLARFFDEGGAGLELLPAPSEPVPFVFVAPPPDPRPALAPAEPTPSNDYDPIASGVIRPPRVRRRSAERPRAVGTEAVISAILRTANHTVLDAISVRSGLGLGKLPVPELRATIAARVELSLILDTLTENQAATAACAVGIEPAGREATVMWLLQRAAPRSADDLKKRVAVSAAEARFLLGLLEGDELAELARGFALDASGDEATLVDRLLAAAER